MHVGPTIDLINGKKKVIDLIIILYHDRCEFRNEVSRCHGSKGGTHTRATDKNATGTDETILLLFFFPIIRRLLYDWISSSAIVDIYNVIVSRSARAPRSDVTFVRLRNESPREPSRRKPAAMVKRCPLFVSRSSLPCLPVSVFPVYDTRSTSAAVIDYTDRLPIILGHRIVIFRGFHRRADRLSTAHCSRPNIFPRSLLAKHHFFLSLLPTPDRSSFC